MLLRIMRKHFPRIPLLCWCLVALALLSFARHPAMAQETCSGIEGRATSIEGRIIPRATILLLNKATKQTTRVETDDAGNYKACLSAGTYDVLASSLGYKPAKRKRVKVGSSSRAMIDFAMKHDASGWVGCGQHHLMTDKFFSYLASTRASTKPCS